MRHASVDEKYARCYNGHIDIDLSERGMREAAQTAKKLKGIEFDAVYSSDLLRCVQSVEPFGFGRVVYDERLREKSWGRAEGMRFDEICDRFGIAYDGFESFVRAVGGESLEEFEKRVADFFAQLGTSRHKNVLVVTHGGVIKTLLGKQKELSLEEAFGLKIDYASITVVEDFV